jgi:predicted transcriptional regulator
LATRELGATGRQLSEMLQITPAAVFYSIGRGEKILEKDNRLQENVKNYLTEVLHF